MRIILVYIHSWSCRQLFEKEYVGRNRLILGWTLHGLNFIFLIQAFAIIYLAMDKDVIRLTWVDLFKKFAVLHCWRRLSAERTKK